MTIMTIPAVRGPLLLASLALGAITACERSSQPFLDPPEPPPASAMVLAPTAIALNDSAGASIPHQAALTISCSGSGPLTGLTLDPVAYQGAAGWLTASLSAATTPATLTLTGADAGLAPGTYIAQVAVRANGANNSPQRVQVRFTVLGSAGSIREGRKGMEGAIPAVSNRGPHQIEARMTTKTPERI